MNEQNLKIPIVPHDIFSYTMMAEPIKTLELHYPMMQFLIKLQYILFFDWISFLIVRLNFISCYGLPSVSALR